MENKRKCLVLVIIILMVFIVNSCDGNKENPISCQCPNEATHLEVGSSDVKCQADNCNHTGDCTEKVNEMLGNGTTKIVKSVGVSTTDFNTLVIAFNDLANSILLVAANSFKANISEVRILTAGSGISYKEQGKVFSVGCDETGATIMPYLIDQGLVQLSQIQPQIKSTWLTDKGNMGKAVYIATTWQRTIIDQWSEFKLVIVL